VSTVLDEWEIYDENRKLKADLTTLKAAVREYLAVSTWASIHNRDRWREAEIVLAALVGEGE